jgi:hypothetical protein
MKRDAGISTFDNKTRELRAGIETCATQLRRSYEVLADVLNRCGDLPILASELGLTPDELQGLRQDHSSIVKEAAEVIAVGKVCCDRLEKVASTVDQKHGKHAGKEVVKPLEGIYTASMAQKIATRYLSSKGVFLNEV